MKQDDRKIEDVDMFEDYEMIPLEPMMYGYDQMNMMPGMNFNQSYGVAMEFRQNTNPNAGMYPLEPNMEMDTNADTGMNPWMETGEFNDNMFMSGFNPMRMTYGDVSMKNAQDDYEGSSQMNIHGDQEDYKDEYNIPNKFNKKYNDVDSIVRRIERYNPLVFRQLSRYGMPYAQAKAVVRRIVRLTLMYSEE
jgi:hypothetical protein